VILEDVLLLVTILAVLVLIVVEGIG